MRIGSGQHVVSVNKALEIMVAKVKNIDLFSGSLDLTEMKDNPVNLCVDRPDMILVQSGNQKEAIFFYLFPPHLKI